MIDDCALLRHVQECIELVQRRTLDGREAFDQDDVLQDAVLRRLETMADAAGRLSMELKARHPDMPWGTISGFRNRLAHGYLHIELDRVWEVVEVDVPALRTVVEEELDRCQRADAGFSL